MTTNGIENIPESLEQAQAAYRAALTGALGMRALGQNSPSWRAEHFAASVRFGLAEPDAMARLHGLTKDLRTIPQLSSLLPRVLDGLMSLTGADHGNIQLLDPTTGMLRLVTQAGFGPEFLDYFAVVGGENGSVCGRAARQCAQIVITDVRADPDFAPHREIAAASRFRGVQSTPLIDYAGHLIGMVSTHYQRPHRPSDRDLRLIELYADFAGEAVSRHLSASRDPGDPVGRAVVSALLDPARVREATVSVQFELWVMGQMAASLARRTERRALAPSAITVPRAQDAFRQD
jgi:GAF domain-containing protein